MTELHVQGTDEARAYREIADEVMRRFGIPLDEAVARINRHWARSMTFLDELSVDTLLHDDPRPGPG